MKSVIIEVNCWCVEPVGMCGRIALVCRTAGVRPRGSFYLWGALRGGRLEDEMPSCESFLKIQATSQEIRAPKDGEKKEERCGCSNGLANRDANQAIRIVANTSVPYTSG